MWVCVCAFDTQKARKYYRLPNWKTHNTWTFDRTITYFFSGFVFLFNWTGKTMVRSHCKKNTSNIIIETLEASVHKKDGVFLWLFRSHCGKRERWEQSSTMLNETHYFFFTSILLTICSLLFLDIFSLFFVHFPFYFFSPKQSFEQCNVSTVTSKRETTLNMKRTKWLHQKWKMISRSKRFE